MNQQLVDAVKRGDVQAVGDLLSAGHSVHTTGDDYGGGLLHAARHTSMVKLLISRGASVNKRDRYGKTPLWRAVEDNKSADYIRALLEAGADVDSIDHNNTTALDKAVIGQHKDLSVLRLLLDFGADINIPDSVECIYSSSRSNISTLEYSFYDVNCSRMVIRFQVLRGGPLDLKPYANRELYDELVQYQNLCILEFVRMYKEVLGCSGGGGKLTLYQFMVAKSQTIRSTTRTRTRTWAQSISDALLERYPLYCEDIRAFREATLERSRLLKDLDGVQMCAAGQEGAWLNNDCMRALGRYLSDEELRNLVAASQVDDQGSAEDDSAAEARVSLPRM